MDGFGKVRHDLAKLRTRTIVLRFNGLEAWLLLVNLQLALKHPENNGESAGMTEAIARRIQAVIADTPELKELAEMGWQP